MFAFRNPWRSLLQSFLIITIISSSMPVTYAQTPILTHETGGTSQEKLQAPIDAETSPVELTYTEVLTLPAFLPYSLDFAVEVTEPAPLAATAVVSVTLPADVMPADALSQQLVRLFFYDETTGQWQKLATERIQAGAAWILCASASGPGIYAAALSTTNGYGDYAQPW